VYHGQRFFLPAPLYAAWAHHLRGDNVAARAAFDSALAVLDSAVRELPDDHRVHAARGLALAGLGRTDEAVREAVQLERSDVYVRDAFSGSLVAEDRARVLAQAGAAEAAVEELKRLLQRPSWLSVQVLRLDPLFDPIRQHPRFQALLSQLP
jgi:serine/threonine-protein kinase